MHGKYSTFLFFYKHLTAPSPVFCLAEKKKPKMKHFKEVYLAF